MLSKPSSICWRSIFNSSLVLGFVGAGGIGFELLTAMNLFQYRTVSLLPLVTFRVSDRGRTAFGRAPTLDRLIGNLTEAGLSVSAKCTDGRKLQSVRRPTLLRLEGSEVGNVIFRVCRRTAEDL